MARPWTTLDAVETEEGRLELRQRDTDDFLIVIDGRVLMSSRAHRSEVEVASLACERLVSRSRAKVLIGGLGMGYTLKAALDGLPEDAEVHVAELNEVVVRWCRASRRSRTTPFVIRACVCTRDVSKIIRGTPANGRWSAIILDLYEGPHQTSTDPGDAFYGRGALSSTRAALVDGGVFSVWSEERDRSFEGRLKRAGFQFDHIRSGRGGRRHPVYIATASPDASRASQGGGNGSSPLRRGARRRR